jgi:membrane glycosyltransferase
MLGLLFGRSVIWSGQLRDAHHLSWKTAFLGLWPQTLFGFVVTGMLAVSNTTLLLASLPLTAGYLLAIPFAVMTARPAFGLWLKQRGLFAIPEERNQPDANEQAEFFAGHGENEIRMRIGKIALDRALTRTLAEEAALEREVLGQAADRQQWPGRSAAGIVRAGAHWTALRAARAGMSAWERPGALMTCCPSPNAVRPTAG